jgi:hypothetical protein
MDRLLAVFKIGMVTLAAIAGAAVVAWVLLFLLMRDTPLYRTAELLCLSVLATAAALGLGGVAVLLRAGRREADAAGALRPLVDPAQTRFLVDIPLMGRYGLLDIRHNTIRGAVIGRSEGKPSPITPVAYDLESQANARIPFPESHPAGSWLDDLFGGQ